MRYKCVVSDLDRTLLNDKSELSEATTEALRHLIAAGVLVVPASGRPFAAFPDCVLNLPGIRYAITSNGVALVDVETKKQIWSLRLKENVAADILTLTEDFGVTYEGFIGGKAYTAQDYFENPVKYGVRPEIISYIQSTRTPVPDIRMFLMENRKNLDCMDVIICPENKKELFAKIKENISGVYVTTSAPHLIEISDADAGKHSGLRKLLAMEQISHSETVAFGDGENDSEMLHEAGLGIAVENAGELCKKAADWITAKSGEDGVAKALYKIFPEIFG